jgi:hypothetical protein
MRYLLALTILLLAGCTHTITLYPRGGGEQASGSVNDGSRNMEVTLRGETYTGSYVLGQTFGLATGTTYGARPVFGTGVMVGNTNQATALLTGPKGVLRCEFVIVAARGGNGVCMDSANMVYDMLIK